MEILGAESVPLFVGTEADPRQVVRVGVRGDDASGREPAQVRIEGDRIRTEQALTIGPLAPGQEARFEVAVSVEAAEPDQRRRAEVVVEAGRQVDREAFEFVVGEPGWRMFMVSHFHYDPVW